MSQATKEMTPPITGDEQPNPLPIRIYINGSTWDAKGPSKTKGKGSTVPFIVEEEDCIVLFDNPNFFDRTYIQLRKGKELLLTVKDNSEPTYFTVLGKTKESPVAPSPRALDLAVTGDPPPIT
jgi:hypothetical protein